MDLTGHGAANRGIVVDKLPLYRNAQASPHVARHDPDARTACRYGGRQA